MPRPLYRNAHSAWAPFRLITDAGQPLSLTFVVKRWAVSATLTDLAIRKAMRP
jgi:hypothetical protein